MSKIKIPLTNLAASLANAADHTGTIHTLYWNLNSPVDTATPTNNTGSQAVAWDAAEAVVDAPILGSGDSLEFRVLSEASGNQVWTEAVTHFIPIPFPDAGLIDHWPMTQATNVNAPNIIAGGQTLSRYSSPVSIPDTDFGSVIQLDGNAYFTSPSTWRSSLTIFHASVWFWPDEYRWAGLIGAHPGFSTWLSPTGVIQTYNGSDVIYISNSVVLGQWNLLEVFYDSANSVFGAAMNGAPFSTQNATIVASTGPFRAGISVYGEKFKGKIGPVYVWDRPLNDVERAGIDQLGVLAS